MSKSPATSQIKAKSSQDKPNESDEVFQQDLKGGNVKLESKYERMKPGEYMIHVFIEETRGLVHPTDPEGVVDAIIKVECLGKTRYSKVKKGSSASVWADHYFFEGVIEHLEQLEKEKIKITVANHRTIGSDSKLGLIEIDFPSVYAHEKHTIFHRWSALANLDKDYEKILGFIKYSVSIITQGDAAIPLKIEELGSNFDPTKVLVPPFLNIKLYQLAVTLFKGQEIKKMDQFGTVDPYVRVYFAGIEFFTKVIKQDMNPVWQQVVYIPVQLPSVADNVQIQIYDSDQVRSELIGSCEISLNDIKEGRYKDFRYLNFYCSPLTGSGKYSDLMNQIPELASYWGGRVLMNITLKENKDTQARVVDVTDLQTVNALNHFPTTRYELRAEAYWAMNLPANGKDYALQIRWANLTTGTKFVNVPKGRMCEWFSTLNPITAVFPHDSYEGLPDVIIWLLDAEDKHFSFARFPSTYFLNQECRPETIYFKIDKSVSKIKDHLAGVVKLRIWIHKMNPSIDLSVGGWNKQLVKKTKMKEWKIIVNLYQARDLIPADDNGSSDPICEIYFNGYIFKSNRIDRTLNPVSI